MIARFDLLGGMMRNLSLILFFSLFLFGCSEEPEKVTIVEGESIEDLIIQLGDSDSYIANKASDKLVKKGRKAIPELLKVIDLPDTNFRYELIIDIFKKMKTKDKDALEAIAEFEKKIWPPASTYSVSPKEGGFVGEGQPIVVTFDEPVKAVEYSLLWRGDKPRFHEAAGENSEWRIFLEEQEIAIIAKQFKVNPGEHVETSIFIFWENYDGSTDSDTPFFEIEVGF